MSEPVVQRQAVPDPQEALRKELVGAIHSARRWSNATPDELVDAVLPVVQAHEQALRDAVSRLADDFAETETLEGTLHPAALSARRFAARRLRSLLGDKEAQQ